MSKSGKIILPATNPDSIDVSKLKPGQVVLFGDSTKEGSISMKRKNGRIDDLAELGSDRTSSVSSCCTDYPNPAQFADAIKDVEDILKKDVVPPSEGFLKTLRPYRMVDSELNINTYLYDKWTGYDIDLYAKEVVASGLVGSWVNELNSLIEDIITCIQILDKNIAYLKKLKNEFEDAQSNTGADLSTPITEFELAIETATTILNQKQEIVAIIKGLVSTLLSSAA
jgi:hypothetical protein